MITGNKGEWSELYVLLKLLAVGRLYVADENSNRITCLPILRIFGQEYQGKQIIYNIIPDNKEIELNISGCKHHSISMNSLGRYANHIYLSIVACKAPSFPILGAEDIMSELGCKVIKAPSKDKTDISLEIYDIKTGQNKICGYSIKSDLGSPPTLLNASKATNFIFEVSGLSDEDIYKVNNISTKSKIKDRLRYISMAGGRISFVGVANLNFSNNLLMIDYWMSSIVAEMLLVYYNNVAVDISDITAVLENDNNLKFARGGIYTYKIKQFLCAVALGMMPSKPWDGLVDATGGYIVVKESGDVLAYPINFQNNFMEYLLNNTKLETPSSSRHNFGVLYKENGKVFVKLNLQIRFKAPEYSSTASFIPPSMAAEDSLPYTT